MRFRLRMEWVAVCLHVSELFWTGELRRQQQRNKCLQLQLGIFLEQRQPGLLPIVRECGLLQWLQQRREQLHLQRWVQLGKHLQVVCFELQCHLRVDRQSQRQHLQLPIRLLLEQLCLCEELLSHQVLERDQPDGPDCL